MKLAIVTTLALALLLGCGANNAQVHVRYTQWTANETSCPDVAVQCDDPADCTVASGWKWWASGCGKRWRCQMASNAGYSVAGAECNLR